ESDRQNSNEHLSMSSSAACESLSVFKPTTFEEAPIPTFVIATPISPIRTPRRGLTIAGEAERRRVTVTCQAEVEPQVRIRRETSGRMGRTLAGTTMRPRVWSSPTRRSKLRENIPRRSRDIRFLVTLTAKAYDSLEKRQRRSSSPALGLPA
ncbi:hypothetical protein CHS0354_035186, partial [Potamilus streckersoni]